MTAPIAARTTVTTWAEALLLAAAGLLATPAAAQDAGLGMVVQNNVNAQLVDPNPAYAGIPIEGSNGLKADTAITRYRSGRVAPLQNFSGNTNIGGAGAGASATSAQTTASGPR
jgi:type IV pilus biogenesis protein CpaD/CtpE